MSTFKKIAANRPLQYFLVVVLIVAVIWYIGYRAARNKFKDSTSVPYPDGGTGLPAQGQRILDNLVDETYDVLDGIWQGTGIKEPVFNQYRALTNDQLTYVYNKYNASFQRTTGETLTQAIEAEWLKSDSMKYVLTRLKTLGLF